jgi:hypothetical protein
LKKLYVEKYNIPRKLYIFAGNFKFIFMTKRRIISRNECINDLSVLLPLIFNAISNAIALFEEEIVLTPPQSRSRSFEASLLNSKMIQCIQENFPDDWKLVDTNVLFYGWRGIICSSRN